MAVGKPGPKKCILPADITKLRKSGLDFINDRKVRKTVHDPSGLVKEVFEETFRLPFEMRDVINYEKNEIATFNNRLSEIRRAIKNESFNSRLGEFFYNTSARAKKYPIANKLLNQMIDVNYAYKGRTAKHTQLYNDMLDGLKTHLRAEGFMSEHFDWKFNKAVKKAEDFDLNIRKLEVAAKQGDKGASVELGILLHKENEWYRKGEGKVFADFIDMIESKLTKTWKDKLEAEYFGPRRTRVNELLDKGWNYEQAWINAQKSIKKPKLESVIADITSSAPLRKSLSSYLELMDNMYVVLERGVGAYVKGAKVALKGRGYSEKDIDVIGKKILESVKPTKEEGGFYPHFRRELNIEYLDGLMAHMENFSNAMSESNRNDSASLQKAMDGIKSFVSKRATGRSKDVESFEYSRNFVANILRYTSEIDRFNYLSHADMYTKQILEQSRQLFGSGELNGYAKDAVRLIQEMNLAMKGKTGFENETLEAATKTLLGFEFVSKLGLNFRSGLRNATQSLLNFVEFGPVMMMKANEFYKNNEMDNVMNKIFKEVGLKFEEGAPQLEEIMGGRIRPFTYEVAGEKIVLKELSKMQKVEQKMGKVGGVTGKIMQKVENWNRKQTFKIAFYKMYKELEMNANYQDFVKKQGKNWEEDAISRARNYAIRMTTLLHYDYSSLSKANYLKHPVGRLLGQFQHYAFKFTEYNHELLTKSLSDIKTGDSFKNKFYGPNSARATRMGLAYFLAPAIATALTGVNWGRLIEHDTASRFDQLATLFTGDDDEIRKKFYGRGVATGLIGAPAISDLLAVGNIWEWWSMNDNDFGALATGFQNYAQVTGDRKVMETAQILNTQLKRTATQTIPMMLGGNLGAALQFEAGLYPTKEAKETQQIAKETIQNALPADMLAAFEELTGRVSAAKDDPFRSNLGRPKQNSDDIFGSEI